MTRLLPLLVLFLVVLAGCRKPVLNDERQFVISNETPSNYITVPAIGQDQTIKVAVTSDEPVSVLMGFEKDKDAIDKEAMSGKFTSKTVAKQMKDKQASLEMNVPANEAALVVVTQATTKKANVKMKLTN
jgi:hypothetical protein